MAILYFVDTTDHVLNVGSPVDGTQNVWSLNPAGPATIADPAPIDDLIVDSTDIGGITWRPWINLLAGYHLRCNTLKSDNANTFQMGGAEAKRFEIRGAGEITIANGATSVNQHANGQPKLGSTNTDINLSNQLPVNNWLHQHVGKAIFNDCDFGSQHVEVYKQGSVITNCKMANLRPRGSLSTITIDGTFSTTANGIISILGFQGANNITVQGNTTGSIRLLNYGSGTLTFDLPNTDLNGVTMIGTGIIENAPTNLPNIFPKVTLTNQRTNFTHVMTQDWTVRAARSINGGLDFATNDRQLTLVDSISQASLAYSNDGVIIGSPTKPIILPATCELEQSSGATSHNGYVSNVLVSASTTLECETNSANNARPVLLDSEINGTVIAAPGDNFVTGWPTFRNCNFNTGSSIVRTSVHSPSIEIDGCNFNGATIDAVTGSPGNTPLSIRGVGSNTFTSTQFVVDGVSRNIDASFGVQLTALTDNGNIPNPDNIDTATGFDPNLTNIFFGADDDAMLPQGVI